MKTQKERDVLRDCKSLLDVFKFHQILDYWRITTGGILQHGKFLVPNKEMAGFSDLIILIAAGPVIFLELKSDKGNQSVNQKAFQARINLVRHKYYLCSSMKILCDILKENGVNVELFIR